MSEAMFPKSVVMAVGAEGFRRGWTEAVNACIAEVEAMPWHFSGIADLIDRVELLPRLQAVLAQEQP